MRLFLGLPWPADRVEALAVRARVWGNRPALRLLVPENWHVTLRFLGEINEDRIPELAAVLETWAKRKSPLTFVDRGWGCFGSYKAPRVVTLSLEAFPDAARAVDGLHKALDEAGFPGDGKPWKPHVTLAYGNGEDPGPWPQELPGGRAPALFNRAALFESTLGPAGSHYEERASVDLIGAGSTVRQRP